MNFKSIAVIIVGLAFVGNVQAAGKSSTQDYLYSPGTSKISNGIRVGLMLPNHSIFDSSSSLSLDSGFAPALGYSSINSQGWGFIAEVSLINYKLLNVNLGSLTKISGSGTYPMSSNTYFLTGVNFSSFSGALAESFKTDMGYQLGAGVKVSDKFSLELAYSFSGVKLKSSSNEFGGLGGVEILAIGTF